MVQTVSSLQIPGGKLTMVVGRVGSGKSTLLLAILGVLKAQEGNIKIYNSKKHNLTFLSLGAIISPTQ